MIPLLILAATAHGSCLDPDEATPAGLRLIDAGIPCKAWRPPPPPILPLTDPQRRLLQTNIRNVFAEHEPDAATFQYRWSADRADRVHYCGFMTRTPSGSEKPISVPFVATFKQDMSLIGLTVWNVRDLVRGDPNQVNEDVVLFCNIKQSELPIKYPPHE